MVYKKKSTLSLETLHKSEASLLWCLRCKVDNCFPNECSISNVWVCSEYIPVNGVIMVAKMLEKSRFLFVLYSCYMKFYFCYIFHTYLICLLHIYYIVISILNAFQFCYRFLFSHYLVLNLCDNVFIFIISTKFLKCKILLIKKYLYFNDSNFLCYMKIFMIWFLPYGW